MLDIEKLIKGKDKLPRIEETESYIISSNVVELDFNKCLMNILIIDLINKKAINKQASIKLSNLEISNLDQSIVNTNQLEKYILKNVLSKTKEVKDFDRWIKGRISFNINKRMNIMAYVEEFKVSENLRSFIKEYKLEDDLVLPIESDLNTLKESAAETLSHVKQKGKRSFSFIDINSQIKTYHFDEKITSELKDKLYFYSNKNCIMEYSYSDKLLGLPQASWLEKEESPFFCENYNEERKKKIVSYFSDDIVADLQQNFNNNMKELYRLEDFSLKELQEMDELREVKDMSLRKENHMYKYYTKEDKVIIEQFSFKENEWITL